MRPSALAATAAFCALLAVSFTAAQDLSLCRDLPEGTNYSAVPPGWEVEAWQDSLRDALAETGQPMPTLCYAQPPRGELILTDPVAQQSLANIGYTERDWARWDGFDLKTDLLFTPLKAAPDTPSPDTANDAAARVWGIGNGGVGDQAPPVVKTSNAPLSGHASVAAGLGQPLSSATYKKAFRYKMESTYLVRGYTRFRWFGNDPTLDYIKELASTGKFDKDNALLNVSLAFNENYNIFRNAKRTQIKNRIVGELRAAGVDPLTRPVDTLIDAEFDALQIDWLKDMPRNQHTMDWLERYLMAVMAKQCLTKNTCFDMFNGKSTDAYGIVQGWDAPNSYSILLQFFWTHDYAYLASRWVKYMRSPIIRKMRQSIQASLANQYAAWSYKLTLEDRLLSQWFMRISGFTTATYFLIRSEQVLRSRGDWLASDEVTQTDWSWGKATTADMLALEEQWLKKYVQRLEKLGASEYLATYYGVTFDYYETALLLAPNQAIYSLIEKIIKMLWFDMSSHFTPGAAALTGATGRHHDATTGLNSRSDYWDIPMYWSILYAPRCAMTVTKTRWDGANADEVINLCTATGSQTLAPMTELWQTWNIVRFHHAAAQAAGVFYMPFDAMVNNSLKAPIRTFSALSTSQLQGTRFTFHRPEYSIGFGVDDAAGVGLTQPQVARLPGVPVAGSAVAVLKKGVTTQVHAQLRHMVEDCDDPFFREGFIWGVVGHDVPRVARAIYAQFQGYQLVTSRVAGRSEYNGADISNPRNTDILLPITVESVLADGTPLPFAEGTVVALPMKTVFLIRHGQSAFAVRIIRADTSAASGIKQATQRTTLSASGYAPTTGKQEYSLTWQVDASSIQAGSGRLTIHHKHKGDSTQGSWRLSVLWAGGRARTWAEAYALQRSVRNAGVTETFSTSGTWDPSKQPWNSAPGGWDGRSDIGSETWTTEVRIGARVNLKVARTDTYNPLKTLSAYQHPTAPVQIAPYYVSWFERSAQGASMFPEFVGANLNWAGQSMQTKPIAAADLLEPHITEPIDCVPGVDFPCHRWKATDFTACSASCKQGTRSRTFTCVDASAGDAAVSDTSLCPPSKPASVETCNLGPCPPSAPTITSVVPGDGFIAVYFTASTDDGGDANTPAGTLSYVVQSSPADAQTTGSTSPIRLAPLTNGRAYTLRVAAVNSRGKGDSSAVSASVTPDAYRWTYSAWTGCGAPCNGGTRTRTASCTSSQGTVSDDVCVSLLGPKPTTLLSEACNVQSCQWSTGAWSQCDAKCSGGTQTRSVVCSTGVGSGTADGWWCTSAPGGGAQPPSTQACNTQACAYAVGEWSQCSVACGSGGVQTRSVSCSTGLLGATDSLATCAAKIGATPPTSQSCNTQACQPNQWVPRAWSACDQLCGGGTQTRDLLCEDAQGNALALTACSAASKPASSQACNTQACVWLSTPFGACSAACGGGGTRTRSSTCGDALGAAVPTSRCGTAAPASTEACNTQACAWAPGLWGECSASCGTGVQTRSLTCTDGLANTLSSAALCVATAPATSQPCDSGVRCIGTPGAPKLTKVEMRDKSALVYFDAPADLGGSTPEQLSYIVNVQLVALPGSGTVTGGDTAPTASGFQASFEDGFSVAGVGASGEAAPSYGALTSVGSASPIQVLGLINGATYTFTVAALSATGSGTASAPSPEATPFAAPAAPTVRAVTKGVESLSGFFEAAALAAGEPAPSFEAWAIPEGTNATLTDADVSAFVAANAPATGTQSPLTVKQLAQLTRYRFAVRATNPSGASSVALSEMGYYPDGVPLATAETVPAAAGPMEEFAGSKSSNVLPIALGIAIPLLLIAAVVGTYLLWRKRTADERAKRFRESSSAAASRDGSRDASRETSQVRGPGYSPPDENAVLTLPAIVVPAQEATVLRVLSPRERRLAAVAAKALSPPPAPGHKRLPSSVRLDVDQVSSASEGVKLPAAAYISGGAAHDPLASPSAMVDAPGARAGSSPLASPSAVDIDWASNAPPLPSGYGRPLPTNVVTMSPPPPNFHGQSPSPSPSPSPPPAQWNSVAQLRERYAGK